MMPVLTHVLLKIINEQLRHRLLLKCQRKRLVAALNQAAVEVLQVIMLLTLMAKEAGLRSVCIVT